MKSLGFPVFPTGGGGSGVRNYKLLQASSTKTGKLGKNSPEHKEASKRH